MKLRLLDNSVRLRLTQTEVKDFISKGSIEANMDFPNGSFGYILRKKDIPSISANFLYNHMIVEVPDNLAQNWASSDQVEMKSEMAFGNGKSIRILIEKDFKCLTDRSGNQDLDAFPNPKEHH